MATIQISELDLTSELLDLIRQTAAEEGQRQAEEFIEKYKKKLELPRFMKLNQTCTYMNCAYNTLQKYKRIGLRTIIIEGEEKVDQKDADAFMNEHKINS